MNLYLGVWTMPIYNYECFNCETKLEVIRPMNESDKTTTCPKCGHSMVRNYDYNGFILKGNGWYKVDQGLYKGHDPVESKKNKGVKIK